MSTLSQDKRTRRLSIDALAVVAAMALSYLEVLLPLTAWIPLPGFRLGLANIVVMLAFFRLSPAEAAVISFVRILLTGLLFGTATSLYFSALGGLCSFVMLFICAKIVGKFSFIGVSVLCAAAHNCGQILAAATLFGGAIVRSYLPLLLIASVVYGGIVGILLNLLEPRIGRRI